MDLDFGFNLGECEVLPRQGTLTVQGDTIHLEPKVMGVLVALAQREGEVVRREELLDEVWPDVVVGDEVLNRSVSILRRHLEDDTNNPQFIQTVPKVGYRLLATVSAMDDHANGQPPPRPIAVESPHARWPKIIIAIVFLIGGTLYWKMQPATNGDNGWIPEGEIVSMAVIPFTERGADDRQVGAGLIDELMSDLGRINRLRVMYRTANGHDDPCEVAKKVDAETLLTGSVQVVNERVRISYQWFASESCHLILSNTHEAPLADLFEVQNAMSKAIVGQLALSLGGQFESAPSYQPPSSPRLYPEVLAGRTYLDIGRNDLKRRGAEPINRAIRIFENLVKEDPNLVSAHLRLAEAYAVLPAYTGTDQELMYQKALHALDQVERLDGTPARTYATRAQIHAAKMEFAEAAEMFRLAVAYTPSDGNVRQWYSVFLSSVGYLERSLEEAIAAADLDRTSPVNIHRLAISYLWMDDDEQAARYFALAQSVGVGAYVNPEPYLLLLHRQGRHDEFIEWMKTIQRTQGRSDDWIPAVMPAVIEPGARNLETALTALDDALRAQEISGRLYWGFMILLKQTDRAVHATRRLLEGGAATDELQFIFAVESAHLRGSTDFPGIVVALGLDKFWDTNGWPRFCARAETAIHCK